jgi:hypothetical protein
MSFPWQIPLLRRRTVPGKLIVIYISVQWGPTDGGEILTRKWEKVKQISGEKDWFLHFDSAGRQRRGRLGASLDRNKLGRSPSRARLFSSVPV